MSDTPATLPPLVYVMGPSGAGKDSVLRRTRELLPGDAKIALAHRYITRPADAGGENHVALTAAEFDTRLAAGLFAYHWRAHGIAYGIGVEIAAWRQAGFVVVVSGSREHFLALGPAVADLHPVLITAPPDVIQRRLIARGRENGASVAERLGRGAAYTVRHPRLTVIDNSGPLDDAAKRLVALLLSLCAPGA